MNSERVTTTTWPIAIATLLIILAIVAGSTAFFFTAVKPYADKQRCLVQAQADFQKAVGDSLSAPPAPNPARDLAVVRIERASDRLDDC